MNTEGSPSVLLIGPYDPHCGEYTFLAPPLGVWRLAGVLSEAGFEAKVFDPQGYSMNGIRGSGYYTVRLWTCVNSIVEWY